MPTRRAVLDGALGIAALAVAAPATPAALAATVPWRPQWAYLQPVTRLVPAVGGQSIGLGWTGTKVSLVQQAVGLGSRFEVYDGTTRDAVRAVQRRRGLPVTGVVDARTWAVLGTGQPWTIDAWRPAIAVAAGASRTERIEAMIRYATAQIGSPYTWGGAGPKALGHDCSGLVLAGLAAAGLDPQPVTVTAHQSPGYVTTEHLYRHPRLERVPMARRQRGDLVFWLDPRGVTKHVAIYLGNGRMIEAKGSTGTRLAAFRGSSPDARLTMYAVRPFTARVR